ncbi:MAG TPA: PAS domain-containing protein [Oxalicibacterium sp.]|uniref:PAS domain-containing sensor histidine kinase n=1 Tax=Oxalicibacterium sp. TaxID=2766525 RepID=UPI002C849331|nr:PAS domain-containing protein [Oxalicibacterium sp.]HWU96898.1 PAS domain-containing protein [Oxalicibacterium sp.]
MIRSLGYRVLLAPLFAAVFIVAVGVISIANAHQQYWILDYRLSDILPVKSNAGLAFLLVGIALALRAFRVSRRGLKTTLNVLAFIFAGLVIAIALPTLSHYLLDLDIDLQSLPAFAVEFVQTHVRYMPPLAAFSIMLAGFCLLFLDYRTARDHYPAEYGAFILVGVTGIPLIGHLYNVISIEGLPSSQAMMPFTSVIFLIIALGILSARPSHRLMSLWNSKSPGGPLLRRLLPNSLLLLVILDFLVKWGVQYGLYDADKTSPLLILLASSLLFIMFCRTAGLLNREYEGRQQGEAALAESNALLRAVSDNTPDAIFVKDTAGRMVFANPANLRLLDKSRAEVLGFRNADLYPDPTDAERVSMEDQSVLESGRARVFETTVNFPGGVRTLHSTKAPWLNARGEIMGLVGISTDITERKRMEDTLKAHETQLEALVAARTAEVSELIGHLETTREEEKRAIARELHDDLGSALTALNMHLSLIFQQMPADPRFTERSLKIKALLSSITDATRRIQNGLRPDKLDVFGIKVAIAEQALEFEKYSGMACNASLPDDALSYAPRVDIALFRMVQESLNNIAKHAQATRVDVILDDTDDEIMLTIRDNGIGIAPERLTNVMTHGLRGMRERAAYLGGSVKVSGAQGSGTTIVVTIPKTDANLAAKTEETTEEGND